MSRHGGGGYHGGGYHGGYGYRGGGGRYYEGYHGGFYGGAYGGLALPLLYGAALGTTAVAASSSQPSQVVYVNNPPPQPIAVIPTSNPQAVAQAYPQYDVYYVPGTPKQ